MRVDEDADPDICVVNTCSVTEVADKKGRQLIRRLHQRHPDAAIVVTGCYAQLKKEEVASLPGVAVVAGSNEKLLLDTFIDRWLSERCQIVEVMPARDIRFSALRANAATAPVISLRCRTAVTIGVHTAPYRWPGGVRARAL